MPPLILREAPYEAAEVQELMAEVQQFYTELYGGEDGAPPDPADFTAPDGVFWLAVLTDGEPSLSIPVEDGGPPAGARTPPAGERTVGCAGLRRHDEQTAELKRMFLRPAYRRQGLGRAMLLAAERRALELGYRRLILETGHQQPEALALYLSHGFTGTANYGYRRHSTTVRSFVKPL